MIYVLDFQRINFNIYNYYSGKNEYVYQKYTTTDKVTHSAKLESNVLIINNGEPIKVSGWDDAIKLVNEYEDNNK